MAFGLLLIRVGFGLALAAHGSQKLFGIFGGFGIAGTGGYFESLGFRPGRHYATLAGVGELVGGLAFAAGLFTPLASALIMASMLVAILGVHLEKGFFSQGGGYEYPLLIAVVTAGIAFTGAGAASLDAALGLRLGGARWGILAIVLGLLGSLPPLLAREVARRRSATT